MSVPIGLMLRHWRRLSPPQQLIAGFLANAALGTVLLCMPWARNVPVSFLDNLFSASSALSTTGLVTVPTGDSYSFFGELVLLLLFQLGGIGYMTVSSFIILARGGRLSPIQQGILRAEFTLPGYFHLDRFVLHVVAFTVIVELVGTGILYHAFSSAGVQRPLWSAVFHTVSAFATAGFGLYGNSLEDFVADPAVNLTIGALCYLGAIGFIVVQDAYYSLRFREYMITFTSKVILVTTAGILLLGTPLMYLIEPQIRRMPPAEGIMAAAFAVMTASTTAGFNTIPIGSMANAALALVVLAMLIGASPSGTGGGIKTTTVSALLATCLSIARGRRRITLLGNEIPLHRLLSAVAVTGFYLGALAVGLFLLCLTERQAPDRLIFEAASALGTVGLSMGITPQLTALGKLIVIGLMFAGRIGPLTLGLAVLRRPPMREDATVDDLAV